MEEMLARVAALEEKIDTDHFKKVFEISCNVALQRLETCEKDIKWRLNRVIDLANRRCNDTIERNGVASKLQRDEVKDLVKNLETRVDSQSKGVTKMEAGLKQLQDLESRLIQIIRQDQNDTTARLEELEKSSTILAAVTADIEACLEAKASKIMNKVTTDIEASLEAKVSTIMYEVSTGMGACLGTTKSKEMFGEAQKGSNAKPVPVRGLSPSDLRSSSLRCPRGSRSSRSRRRKEWSRLTSTGRRTNAEHGASVTAEDDAPSCSLDRRLQTEASGDTNHALQMALGRDILRRNREQHRGRASSVHEMIQAAQGEAYSRVVAARRSASLQPDELLPLSVRHPRRWYPIERDP